MARLARYHGDKAQWVLDAWTKTWLSAEFAGWKLDDDLGRLDCPLLAIHGDRDEFGTQRQPDAIGGLTQAAGEVIILDDCGHVPHREKPEAVLRVVCALLDSI